MNTRCPHGYLQEDRLTGAVICDYCNSHAPELLEALELLLTAEGEGNTTNADRAHCEAVIAKARGES